MTTTGTIFQFPTGREVDPGAVATGTVAAIAEGLYRGLRRRGALPRSRRTVQVSLPALCGVTDQTIHRLVAIAAAGAITPESAARLALRHAKEIGAVRRTGGRRVRGVPGVYDVHLLGVGPGSFAVRIGSADGGSWIAIASIASYPRLLRIAVNCRAIILLVGKADAAGIPVHVATTPSWQVTLIGRSMRPGWRALRHLLVIGGLPNDQRERADAAAAIVHSLRANPDVVVLSKEAFVLRPGTLSKPVVTRIFQLLAVAMPNLLGDGGRP